MIIKKISILVLIPLMLSFIDGFAQTTKITVHNKIIADIDKRIFGHFLEKPSWHNELGPEAALRPNTNQLQKGVVELLKGMNIPVMRFPGGTDVNLQDWTTMIDNVPGRESVMKRPFFIGSAGDTVTNNFGYDEMFELANELNSEVMLVINFGDAYFGRKSLKEAVLHEAGLLAYTNVDVGDELPEGMPDWPSIRKKNGHSEPYGVKYVQIANEPWVMDRNLKRRGPIIESLKERYFSTLKAFIDIFKEIDPDIKIIADGNSEELTVPLKERFGDKIDYLSYHIYKPWAISEVHYKHSVVHIDSLTMEDIWLGWVSVPGFNEDGMSVFVDDIYNVSKAMGYPIAITEWNWNGWWDIKNLEEQPLESRFIKGVGAAGFIHAMMREADVIKIANQSMLLGNSWDITGIRVSPNMEFKPHIYPTAQVTGFYSRYHGNELLDATIENASSYNQLFTFNGIPPARNISYLDILATRSSDNVYLHIINRHFDKDIAIEVNLSEVLDGSSEVIHRIFEGNLNNSACNEESLQTGCFRNMKVNYDSKSNRFILPKRSVSIIEIML